MWLQIIRQHESHVALVHPDSSTVIQKQQQKFVPVARCAKKSSKGNSGKPVYHLGDVRSTSVDECITVSPLATTNVRTWWLQGHFRLYVQPIHTCRGRPNSRRQYRRKHFWFFAYQKPESSITTFDVDSRSKYSPLQT